MAGDEVTEVSDKGVHTLSSEGVTKGFPFKGFHWRNPSTGWTSERFTAMGQRNLEFRRAEAQKNDFDFVECHDKECKH